MKKYNSLVVNSKKLALSIFLITTLCACRHDKKDAQQVEPVISDTVERAEDVQQQQKNRKTLLWFAPLIMLGAAGGALFCADEKSKHR